MSRSQVRIPSQALIKIINCVVICHAVFLFTYLKLWNAIPPQIPVIFKNFIARITRNTALSFYRRKHRIKRGADTNDQTFDENEAFAFYPAEYF